MNSLHLARVHAPGTPRIPSRLDNLMGNAIKYSPEGGTVTLWITTARRPGGPGGAELGATPKSVGRIVAGVTELPAAGVLLTADSAA